MWNVAKHIHKLLEDLQIINKEVAEYINSPSWDCPTFFNDNEDHSVQYKEYLKNPSNEIAASNSNQEKKKPPQDSDIHQFVREECGINICEKQRQNMEDTMLELIEVCRQKEFYCMHDNVDDLIESALNSKLLSINLESQRLVKKKQEVKNVIEQQTERGTRIAKSFHNFRVIHKSSISLNNTSQISPVHSIAPVLPTEEPEYSPSMGEYEITSDDENECDVPVKDESSLVFTTFSNPLFNDNDDFTSSNDESLPDEDVPIEEFKVYSNPIFDDEEIHSDKLDPHCFNVESDFVESLSNRDTLIYSYPKFDYLEEFSGALMPIRIADEERIRREHAEYISLMDREEIDIVTNTDELLPPGFENDDSEGEIYEELRVDNYIPNSENELSDNEASDHDNPSFQRPPPEPPNVEFDFEPNSGVVIAIVMNNIDELNEDECFDP
uniref:Uncharacterized protein n=1 Tax=Tanacetum cinerariifolium TaxID=118510 RepID=A0A699JD59_TANCI|nr:hypothetical protein [Tanacetum cinerariifolium]